MKHTFLPESVPACHCPPPYPLCLSLAPGPLLWAGCGFCCCSARWWLAHPTGGGRGQPMGSTEGAYLSLFYYTGPGPQTYQTEGKHRICVWGKYGLCCACAAFKNTKENKKTRWVYCHGKLSTVTAKWSYRRPVEDNPIFVKAENLCMWV